jgi:hypothetical protein
MTNRLSFFDTDECVNLGLAPTLVRRNESPTDGDRFNAVSNSMLLPAVDAVVAKMDSDAQPLSLRLGRLRFAGGLEPSPH